MFRWVWSQLWFCFKVFCKRVKLACEMLEPVLPLAEFAMPSNANQFCTCSAVSGYILWLVLTQPFLSHSLPPGIHTDFPNRTWKMQLGSPRWQCPSPSAKDLTYHLEIFLNQFLVGSLWLFAGMGWTPVSWRRGSSLPPGLARNSWKISSMQLTKTRQAQRVSQGCERPSINEQSLTDCIVPMGGKL